MTTESRSLAAGARHDEALDATAPLLTVEDLHVDYGSGSSPVHAVNGLSYTVEPGETLAILGESGSGKTASAQAVLGLLTKPEGHITSGSIRFRGLELTELDENEYRAVRGRRIAMVFQSALAALNPTMTVGKQIAETFVIHEGMSYREGLKRAAVLMDRVRIPNAKARLGDFPHQFSGGMKQRIIIATAIALDPSVLIADEPTTALDVTVQAQIMALLAEIQADSGMAMILITHDIAVAAEVAQKVIVMYAGRAAETGSVTEVFGSPAHPYTVGLMGSLPRLQRRDLPLTAIGGSPPDLRNLPVGCEFADRCYRAEAICRTDRPALEPVAGGHESACHFRAEIRA